MHQEVFDKYALLVQKTPDGRLDVQTHHYLLKAYLPGFWTDILLEAILHDIRLAINGKFIQIEDPDWTMSHGPIDWCGYIRLNDKFELSYNDNTDETVYYPLADMAAIFENLWQIVKER